MWQASCVKSMDFSKFTLSTRNTTIWRMKTHIISFSICLLELTTWLKRRSNLCRCRRRKCRGHWKWRIVHIHLLTFFVLNGYLDQKNDLCHNETWFGNVVWLFWALAIKDSGQKCDTESTTSQPNSSPVKAGVKERTVTQAIQTKWSLIGEDLIT